ncbi:MAG: V-type ATP synthase subunit F [Candidatus Micrarchaeota archaeon]
MVEKNDDNRLPHKIVVVGYQTTLTGFRLAGIQETFSAENGDCEEIVAKLLGREDVGVILINRRIVQSFDWRMKRRIEKTTKPVVVEIPDSKGELPEEESLGELMKRALGFDISK